MSIEFLEAAGVRLRKLAEGLAVLRGILHHDAHG